MIIGQRRSLSSSSASVIPSLPSRRMSISTRSGLASRNSDVASVAVDACPTTSCPRRSRFDLRPSPTSVSSSTIKTRRLAPFPRKLLAPPPLVSAVGLWVAWVINFTPTHLSPPAASASIPSSIMSPSHRASEPARAPPELIHSHEPEDIDEHHRDDDVKPARVMGDQQRAEHAEQEAAGHAAPEQRLSQRAHGSPRVLARRSS